jgi:hypothetical protein
VIYRNWLPSGFSLAAKAVVGALDRALGVVGKLPVVVPVT